MYGVMLLVAIAACVALTGVRYVRRGGDWDTVPRVAVWGVAAGIVGARLYHDITSWGEVPDPKWKGIFQVWKGGLGVGRDPVRLHRGLDHRRRSGKSAAVLADAAAPGCCSHRGSAGSATGSTRSCTASRPTSVGARDRPGASRCGLRGRTRPSTRPSSTSSSTTCRWWGCSAHRLAVPDQAAGALRALRVLLHVRSLLRGALADRSRARARGLRLNAWVSVVLFVGSTAFFIWWQFFRGQGEREAAGGAARRATRMAIPKGKGASDPETSLRGP